MLHFFAGHTSQLLTYHYPGQCSIPPFEGLLPEPFNEKLLRLLYKVAELHALAKLRMHTDSTLNILKAVTREFSHLMQQFCNETSEKFDTILLPHEAGAQKRACSSKKVLNLNTYKFYSLGDYIKTIHLFRTTDSYPTQVVSLTFALPLPPALKLSAL